MIGIDGNEANIVERVGSNVYAYQILTGLAALKPESNYQIYLKQPPINDLPQANKKWQYRQLGAAPLWTQWRLPLDLYTHQPQPQIFFTPGHYAPRWSPVPTVITIFDLAFLYFPETFEPRVLRQLKSWTKYSVLNAAHILTISHQTKKDIIKEYHIHPDKITVTHLASNVTKPAVWNAQIRQEIMIKYAIPTKYFLFVGTRQPRKNLDRLVTAFKKVHAKERNISLVIAGKVWHQFKTSELASHPQIVITGYVPEADLASLIMGSEALVFPSLYEGFGLPVLEAMKLGSLVAAANTSSIPEITGESPLLFNPKSVSQIQHVLWQILHMGPDTKKKLIREGKIHTHQFSWDKTIQQTQTVLNRVIQQTKN